LESVQKKLKKIIEKREKHQKDEGMKTPRLTLICFEEIRICPKVYPALKEIISSLKDPQLHFILIKDNLLEQKQMHALLEKNEKGHFNDDSIFFENYLASDTDV
jgi:hypothetical protein